MDRKFRWILAASLLFGVGLAACSSPTMPRFPSEEDDGSEDSSGEEPGQAMILEGIDFAEELILV